MLKKLKKITLQLIAGANVGTLLLMLLVGYSDRLAPADYPMLSTVGMAFPLFLLLNVAFLVFWLFVKKRYALIPFFGLLMGFQPVHNYCPLNLPHADSTDSVLKVLTFNAYDNKRLGQKDFRAQVADYLLDEDAHFVCLQEISINDDFREALSDRYAYIDTTRVTRGGEMLTLLSKFPIVGKQKIYTEVPGEQEKSARSVVFFVIVGADTVAVVNNHLESTRLTEQERSNFKRIVKGDMERNAAEQESKKLIERLAESNQLRQPQVEAVAENVDSLLTNTGCSVILCGDFNDGPISYSHHLVNTLLTDCYADGAFGPAVSYHENALYVRIDHIFCSDDWKVLKTKVDTKMSLSDHYPLISTLKMRPKP